MSLKSPSISGTKITMNVTESTVNPLSDVTTISLPLSFANAANIRVISGTYTPNNDLVFPGALNAIPSGQAPDLIFLICDAQINLTVNTNSGNTTSLNFAPVWKEFLWKLPSGLAALGVNSIEFDGRAALPFPMAQGVPVNYTLIIGQVTQA